MTRRRPTGANAPTFNAADEGKLMRLLRTLAKQAAQEEFRAHRDSNVTLTGPGSQRGPPIQQGDGAEGMTSDARQEIGADERHFTVAEIAEQLGVSQKSVRRAIGKGELPAVRFGKLLRVGERGRAAYLARARLHKDQHK